jgi:hypothetical protein
MQQEKRSVKATEGAEMLNPPSDRMTDRRALREFVERCFEHRFRVCDVGGAGATAAVLLDFIEIAPAERNAAAWHKPLPSFRLERTAFL